jgi:hypothetical protein
MIKKTAQAVSANETGNPTIARFAPLGSHKPAINPTV